MDWQIGVLALLYKEIAWRVCAPLSDSKFHLESFPVSSGRSVSGPSPFSHCTNTVRACASSPGTI